MGGTINRAEFETYSNTPFDITAAEAAQLDRQADLLLSVGRHDAAERLAHRAADLRAGVA
jgi:hypothetical protein